jgi:hypothetical protein
MFIYEIEWAGLKSKQAWSRLGSQSSKLPLGWDSRIAYRVEIHPHHSVRIWEIIRPDDSLCGWEKIRPVDPLRK